MAADDDPITEWIAGLKAGDEAAIADLWDRYFERLIQLARQRFGNIPRRVADEEDIAVSVFRCLCAGAERGRLAEISSRDDLWRVLVTMTLRKIIDQQRRLGVQKRGAGKVRGESVFGRESDRQRAAGLQQFGDHLPTPRMMAVIEEEGQRLLDALENETLRQIAIWKLEAFTNDEIADKLGLATRSVERKLERIRGIWSQVVET